MSSRDWRLRVQDILEAIEVIEQRLQELSYEEFIADAVLVESVLYKFIVIGEAAVNIPDEIRALAPELPWRQMSDMRNIMAHKYFRVKIDIVWETAQHNLPTLVEPLRNLLEQ